VLPAIGCLPQPVTEDEPVLRRREADAPHAHTAG
jgi:hypothetical protein